MANPTTYFGWVMPNSADLVTDLPADFNVFGQGVDTSMQYLLGGTTGQVLSKTSATNMAFTWVTPTDQTPLTTKGDLFTFTPVDARLAVGTNGYGLVADSTAGTGLKWAASTNFHGAYVYKSTTQAIANNTEVAVTFDSEITDTDGYHDNVTNNTRLTIPAGLGGSYAVTGTIAYTGNATGVRYVVIKKNGNIFYYTVLNNAGTVECIFQATQVIPLAAGDYVEMFAIQVSGGSLDIKGAFTYFTNFSCSLIGA